MPNDILKVKITGFSELGTVLKALGAKAGKAKSDALKEAAPLAVDKMRELAPEYHGDYYKIPQGFLRDSISFLIGVDKKDRNTLVAYIGPNMKRDYPRRGTKMVKERATGKKVQGTTIAVHTIAAWFEFGVNPSHVPWRPFISQTFYQIKDGAQAAIADALRKALGLK